MYRTFLLKGDSAIKIASSAQKIHPSLAASCAKTFSYKVATVAKEFKFAGTRELQLENNFVAFY
jgi:hypothetical protein